jgi:hypothetical protein
MVTDRGSKGGARLRHNSFPGSSFWFFAALVATLLIGIAGHPPTASANSSEHGGENARTEEVDGEKDTKPKPRGVSVEELMRKADPRGAPELTLCSQNLNNLGDLSLTRQRLDLSMTAAGFAKKLNGLAARMIAGRCDVIAVQELLGRNDKAAKENIDRLAQALHSKTGRFFETLLGNTNDPLSRVGYLIAVDRAEVLAQVSYNRIELPKILPKERPRYFLRGPLEVQLSVRGRDGTQSKIVTVVNFHLKSKGGKERDPAELEWETYRMQMAEAVRRVVESRHERAFASGETLLAVVGDRNSNFDAASNEILSGSLTLDDFKLKGGCRLSKRGIAFCEKSKHRALRLFSVLTNDPQLKNLTGTFHFRDVYSWLDDILVPQETLRFAWDDFSREGDYSSFVINEPEGVSDHSLVGVAFNW